MVTLLRTVWRGTLLFIHILLGVFLTIVSIHKHAPSNSYRSSPKFVMWWHGRIRRILHLHVSVAGDHPIMPSLIISNHISWIDICVIGEQCQTNFLSKDDVRNWPIIGWLASTSGTFFIKRGAAQLDKIQAEMAFHIKHDGLLTLFPEGTTTDGTDVRTFFPRLFAVAINNKIKITPVALQYLHNGQPDPLAPYIGDQSLLDNLIGLLKRKESHVKITFLVPFDASSLNRKQAANQAHEAIRSIIV